VREVRVDVVVGHLVYQLFESLQFDHRCCPVPEPRLRPVGELFEYHRVDPFGHHGDVEFVHPGAGGAEFVRNRREFGWCVLLVGGLGNLYLSARSVTYDSGGQRTGLCCCGGGCMVFGVWCAAPRLAGSFGDLWCRGWRSENVSAGARGTLVFGARRTLFGVARRTLCGGARRTLFCCARRPVFCGARRTLCCGARRT
jgi:hypothetical protein